MSTVYLSLYTKIRKNDTIYKDKVGGKMARKIKILFSLSAFCIILGLVLNFTTSFKQDKQEVAKRMKVINSTYELFKENTTEFSNTRDNLYDNVFSELYFETLNITIPNCLEELQKYENVLNQVETEAKRLQKNCQDIYFPSSDVNTKCKTSLEKYEEMVNYFVNDITQVNQNIEEYNKYNQENQTGIAPVQKYNTTKKYIDFNKDSEYTGKEDF